MSIRKQSQTLVVSAARTATVVSALFSAEEVICTDITIDVTAVSATPTITVKVEGKDPLSGAFYTILTSAGLTATGTVVLRIGKDIIAAANVAANAMLPSEYRITSTHTDGDSITYSIGAVHMVHN